MPFNPDGSFSPVAGAVDAFPGQVIASATWNSINEDYDTALTLLGQGGLAVAPRVITISGTVTVADTDLVIAMNLGSPSAITFDLPAVAGRSSAALYVFDFAGNAGPMTFTPHGVETIMGLASWSATGSGAGLGGSVLLIPVTGLGWLAR